MGNMRELFKLAEDRSLAGRSMLVERVSDVFLTTGRELTDAEYGIMSDILRRLVEDVASEVRAALAEGLAEWPETPRDLIKQLANDEIMVAESILLRSDLLEDAELIDIVNLRTTQHRLAIAARETLSEGVTDALVEAGEQSVIERLLANKGSILSAKTMKFLVEESQNIEAYQEPLIRRDELSVELAERMYGWVSKALKKQITEYFDVDPAILDQTMDATIEKLINEVRARSRQGKRPVQLKELLAYAQATDPDFLIALLREGQIALFEGLLAELTKLPIETAQRFIYEPRGEAFAIACKGAQIPKSQFGTILVLSREVRPKKQVLDRSEIPRAINVFDRVPEETARAVLKKWRTDPEYLSMIRHFPLEQFDDLDLS